MTPNRAFLIRTALVAASVAYLTRSASPLDALAAAILAGLLFARLDRLVAYLAPKPPSRNPWTNKN
jgi:hypothetical protein